MAIYWKIWVATTDCLYWQRGIVGNPLPHLAGNKGIKQHWDLGNDRLSSQKAIKLDLTESRRGLLLRDHWQADARLTRNKAWWDNHKCQQIFRHFRFYCAKQAFCLRNQESSQEERYIVTVDGPCGYTPRQSAAIKSWLGPGRYLFPINTSLHISFLWSPPSGPSTMKICGSHEAISAHDRILDNLAGGRNLMISISV